jgi:broad specificity phosphatase PhoE
MAGHLHLLRHGEVENPDHVVYAGLPGFHLTDRGRRQAREAARYLGRQPVVAVWSSPLERALETASIVADRFRLPVLVDDDLVEWRLADRWAGICWEDLPGRLPGELEAYMATPEDLPFSPESLSDLADRMRAVVQRIHARHPEGDAVVISHQDPIQAARLVLAGRPLSDLWSDKPAHAEVITLRPHTPWQELSRWAPDDQGDDPTRTRAEPSSVEPGEQLTIGGEGEVG